MSTNKNYYDVLKVSPLASPSAIKQAYRKLARIHHPDKNPNNPEATNTFKQINEAYQILSDSFKRKDFDRKIKKEKEELEKKNKPSAPPMYDSFYSAPSPSAYDHPPQAPHFTKPQSNTQHPDKEPFSPLKNIKNYFSNKKSSTPNVHEKIKVSLEEAILGCKKHISLKVLRAGTLKLEKYFIYIPPGSKENDLIKIKNPAISKLNETLYVSIQYKEHPLFKPDKTNILMDLPISFTTAVLGGEVQIPTLRGQVVFNIPPKTHGGYIIKLKGQGLSKDSKKRGDMLVKVVIDIPSKISEEEITWIKKIHQKKPLCPKVAEFDIKTKLLLKNRSNKKNS